MITVDKIDQLPVNTFYDSGALSRIEEEILATPDDDDRDWLLYNVGRRLIKEGILEDGERIARLMQTWPIERAWFLGDIAMKLWHLGQKERAVELLDETTSIARSSGREWQRAESLAKVARHFGEIGKKGKAIALLYEAVPIAQYGQEHGTGHDSEDAQSVLREVAEALVTYSEFEKAKEVANSIKHSIKRARAMELVEAKISESGGAERSGR